MPPFTKTRAAVTGRKEDRVYTDDAADGRDTLEWIAA